MRHALLALALAAASTPVAASSLSSTFTVASDYLFDGVSQTQNDPALQASLDWSHDSGFFLGTWASNVDFAPGDPANVEIDLYGGYATEYDSGWGWTTGIYHYSYSGAPSSYDYTEFSAGLTFPTTTTLQGWVADDDALGGDAWRIKAKHSFALPNDFSLDLEATRTEYDGDLLDDYTHVQIGVSREFGAFKAYLGYSDTNLDDDSRVAGNGDSVADGRILLTLSGTVTWFE
jgi:uncharacterized protein (TIGR02001 family)